MESLTSSLEQFWENCGTLVGPFLYIFETNAGLCWDIFGGIILGPIRGQFGDNSRLLNWHAFIANAGRSIGKRTCRQKNVGGWEPRGGTRARLPKT